MPFKIRMGIPEMEAYWSDMQTRALKNKLSKGELKRFKKLAKAFFYLSQNPKHNALNSHEIAPLSARYERYLGKGIKVWQSYVENRTPAAGRFYWVYAPGRGEITIIGLEPHPEDKKRGGYDSVKLSMLPPAMEE